MCVCRQGLRQGEGKEGPLAAVAWSTLLAARGAGVLAEGGQKGELVLCRGPGMPQHEHGSLRVHHSSPPHSMLRGNKAEVHLPLT
eukprot:1153993-Pelagomonas_calceolata.AAC.1